MKISILACVASALAGTVNVGIHKDTPKNRNIGKSNGMFREIHRQHAKRDAVTLALDDAFYRLYATMYIGSDRQKVIAAIDTGSSDLFVMKSTNPYCEDNDYCTGMTFDPSTSTTFKNTTEPWDIQYYDTTGAFGFLCQDTIEVGGASVPNAYVAVAGYTNMTDNIFGVSFINDETTTEFNGDSGQASNTYPNYPVSLKQDGFINTISYSLYLNSLEGQEGNILFGGVDHAKHTGTLGLMPVVNIYWWIATPPSFVVMLNEINLSSNGTSCPLVTDFAYPVLLDSGSSLAILPNETVGAMADAYGFTWNEHDAFYEGSCTPVLDFDSFEISFSGVKVNIPADSLLGPYASNGGCILAVQIGENHQDFLLGDNFLRSLYVVYDLENYQVAIAQANYTDESDVEEIISTIPSATTAPLYHSTNYVSRVSIQNADACETETTTVATHGWHDDAPSVLRTLYYGSQTPSATAEPTGPNTNTRDAL